VDIIAEVSHPDIVKQYGALFVQHADFFVGSPTAFADSEFEKAFRTAVEKGHAAYVPAGALWGAVDLSKMGERGTLKKLEITMAKHPSGMKLNGEPQRKLQQYIGTFCFYIFSCKEKFNQLQPLSFPH
tara:strand:+ start:249 stop:632 length:384 start_codon:yes stop_codon:yes gene_type:complete